MSGSLPQLQTFQLPDVGGVVNALQGLELNRMRSQQLQGAEQERTATRELFSRPGFDPFAPGSANELLRVAPTTGAATFQALMRARADERAGQASLRAAAASARQAQTALTENEIKSIELGQRLLIPVRDLPEAERPRAYATWLAGMERRIPGFSASAPREYSDAGYYALLSKASEIVAGQKPREGFTLSPGQTRFDAEGRPIAAADARDPAREVKIRDIMDTFNVDRRTAVGIESGVLRPIADPVTGETRLVDLTNNTFRQTTPAPLAAGTAPTAPVPAPAPAPLVGGPRAGLTPPPAVAETAPTAAPAAAAAPAAPPAAAQPTLYDLAQIPRTTGLGPATGEFLQRGLGQVGVNVVSPEFTARRQRFETAKNEALRAWALNTRFPVAEMERILKDYDITAAKFTDPQTLVTNIRNATSELRRRLANEERAGSDLNLPASERQQARISANNIANFLKLLGGPEEPLAPQAPDRAPRGRNTLDRQTQTGARPGEIRTPGGFILRPIQ